jgi:large subunit ribosomal protein L16
MLEPKKRKYRKDFRGRMKGKSHRGSTLAFGDFGLKAMGRGWLSSRQIEAGRRAITHSIKRGGKVWIRVFPDKPVTSRPAGQRMGGGKGDIDRYVAVITPGRIIYEVTGIAEELVVEAFGKAGAKMPFKTKIVKKEGVGIS